MPPLPHPTVFELRQYTLHPGRRDDLIALFEREFIEPQQDEGIAVVGTFRDLDDPDRFVWMRAFADMGSRAQALGAFYGGNVWKQHRESANATMVDSDDVLLLRPLEDAKALLAALDRRPAVCSEPAGGVFGITICPLRAPAGADLTRAFHQWVRPAWAATGGDLLACWVTEHSPNTSPRLPVRDGESVIAWLTRFDDEAAQQRHAALLASSGSLRQEAWRAFLCDEPSHLRLAPTPRSPLRGGSLFDR